MTRLVLPLLLASFAAGSVFQQTSSLASGAQPSSGAAAAARSAMEQADRDFCRAVAERNVEQFKTFIADDAVFFGGAGGTHGVEAIARSWAPLMAQDRKTTLTWEPKMSEAAASGDLGYTRGAYERTVTDPQGKVEKSHGTYVSIWRRHKDGRWKVVLDIGTPPQPK